jgi:hypothetical protein
MVTTCPRGRDQILWRVTPVRETEHGCRSRVLKSSSGQPRSVIHDGEVPLNLVSEREGTPQGPGKVVMGVWLEVIGVDAPVLEAAGRA